MAITPQTDLYLLKCPIEQDNKNQIKFANKNAQLNYFSNLPHLFVNNFTYQRKDNIIRYPSHIDNIMTYNYVMYKNEAYTNKWFFAFITNMKYVNDNMTEITIKTDVFQTWQFEMVFKNSFVEREHVNDDTIGLHTIPEQLETGDYVFESYSIMNYGTLYANPYYVCVGVSENLLDTSSNIQEYNRIYSGVQYMVIRDEDSLSRLIKKYDRASKKDAIYCLFMIPGGFIDNGHAITWDVVDNIHYLSVSSSEEETIIKTINISRPTQIGVSSNKYTPKNKKLLTGEYVYILADNMSGSVVKYNYEYFSDPTSCEFKCVGAITPGCSLQTYPRNYKNIPNNLSEGFLNAKLPICSWNSDVYTNWLTQNGVNIALQIGGSLLQTAGGIALATTGAGALVGGSQIASGALGIANTLGQVYEHSLAPDQAQGNINNGDVLFSQNRSYPTLYRMSIKEEYAKIIDNYFSMFGYKVNTLKVPNLTGRRNWNYVQTIGAIIEGEIPQDDTDELKSIFNSGITIWHNTNTYLDYSQNNDII